MALITHITELIDIEQEEVFVPILYVTRVANLDEAIAFNNAVPQVSQNAASLTT
jgi:acyl-CoA reductase-like NAD-dependent aldehyde dehydrogenase